MPRFPSDAILAMALPHTASPTPAERSIDAVITLDRIAWRAL
jgi:hypothetical protein